jgi:polyisoprenyl-phosphate glycosyltransferase
MKTRHATIVVPVHNEAENVPALVQEVARATAGIQGWTLGILFVDDGSSDETVAVIEKLRPAAPIPLGCLRFSRNFGHQAALEAGLLHATGDVVISMDGDLQHPPADIPRMLEAYDTGTDVVQMIRGRPSVGIKGFLSRRFYRFFATWAHADIVPDASDYRLMSRRVIEVLRKIPEREKFLRGLLPTLGFKRSDLRYEEGVRTAGQPSYTFKRSLRLASKALFDFSTLPLRFIYGFGMTLAVVSFLWGIGHIIKKLLTTESVVPGFTDIIVSLLFLCGCILVSLGIIGRYLMLILDQVRGRPPYVVSSLTQPEIPAGSKDVAVS